MRPRSTLLVTILVLAVVAAAPAGAAGPLPDPAAPPRLVVFESFMNPG